MSRAKSRPPVNACDNQENRSGLARRGDQYSFTGQTFRAKKAVRVDEGTCPSGEDLRKSDSQFRAVVTDQSLKLQYHLRGDSTGAARAKSLLHDLKN